jgi:hydrogenase expression/formation protein HypE
MRDPTRGGVASSLNELAMDTELGVRLNETSLPISRSVRGVCELLGLDPLYVANEGKLLAVVSSETAEMALEALKAHPLGRDSAVIGEMTSENPGIVVLETLFGGTRVVDMLVGDPLPRIC